MKILFVTLTAILVTTPIMAQEIPGDGDGSGRRTYRNDSSQNQSASVDRDQPNPSRSMEVNSPIEYSVEEGPNGSPVRRLRGHSSDPQSAVAHALDSGWRLTTYDEKNQVLNSFSSSDKVTLAFVQQNFTNLDVEEVRAGLYYRIYDNAHNLIESVRVEKMAPRPSRAE